MIREFTIWVGDLMFVLMGGVPLANSLFVLVWVVFWTGVMVLPMWFLILAAKKMGSTKPYRWYFGAIPLFLITFFGGLFIAVGVPIVQSERFVECRTDLVEVIQTDNGLPMNIKITYCRERANINDEFGPFRFRKAENVTP